MKIPAKFHKLLRPYHPSTSLLITIGWLTSLVLVVGGISVFAFSGKAKDARDLSLNIPKTSVTPVVPTPTASATPTVQPITASAVQSKYLYGTLQSDPKRITSNVAAGIHVATLEASWAQFETGSGVYSQSYISELKSRLAAFKSKGMNVVLDLGEQYAPNWVLTMPDGRYVNQHGDSYTDSTIGKNIPNLVFNQAQREAYATYINTLLSKLDANNFYAVRLGGGWYGELNYPPSDWNGQTNSYWGFDNIAMGIDPGRSPGIPANPVPGWVPGTPSVEHNQASLFADWYMASLENYQNWQITTVRQSYSGNLLMLYPAWGLRSGQLNAAINVDLNGTTSPEINGETQHGGDYSRYVASITDPKVIIYTTWLDAAYGTDSGTDSTQWRPVHWLSTLAAANGNHFQMWGENSGSDSYRQMQFSFQQAITYNLLGVIWAFEPDLYSGKYATIGQYKSLISNTP